MPRVPMSETMHLTKFFLVSLTVGVLAEMENGLPLEEDDECFAARAGEASDRCALNALQRSRLMAQGLANHTDLDHPFIKDCHIAGRGCPSGLACVSKPDGTWSQCVDCSTTTAFWKDCVMMNAEMREAATAKCGIQCPYTTPKPLESGCAADGGASCSGHEKCVSTADGTWSQCVDCSQRFYKDCQKFESPMRLAAVLACKRTCLGTKCEGKEWCHSPYKCVGSKTWAQCVRCDAKTFKYTCRHWKKDMVDAAQHHCKRRCRR
mmetsp:Transcript_106834/g.319396  ORF Transcript_106834/g.319396 Transcript_106834/m.319396 type:complete len:264 (-) Transcript_106834:57-848(-)